MAPVLPTINIGPQTPVNMGDVFNPVGISQTDYGSRPVNFYGEGLDTSISVDTVDEQEDGADEVVSPSIYGDDGGDSVAGQGQIIAGPNAGKSVLQSAFANTKMYGVSDINLNSSAFKGTDLTKSPFSNYFDVASGELSNVLKAQKAAGLGTPMADSIIKGRQSAVGVPGAMAPVVAGAGPIGLLMPLGAAAARAMQARDAAAIMAANGKAGAMFDLNGMLLTRSPGSFQYTGNMQGYTQEQVMAIEAVKRGYIPGTLSEKKVGSTWITSGRSAFGMGADDMIAGGGIYDPSTGGFIGLDGSRSAVGTKESAAALASKMNSTYGSSLSWRDIATARSQVQRTGLFGLGGVKPGTRTFEQIISDMASTQGKQIQAANEAANEVAQEADRDSAFDDEAGDIGISSSSGSYDQPEDNEATGEDFDESFAFGGSVDDASDDDMGDVATMESSYSADPDAFADEDAGMYDSSDGGNDDNTIETIRQNILSAVSAKQLSNSDKKQLSEQMSVIGSRNKFNEAVKKEMDRFKSTEYKPSTNNTREDVIGQAAKSSLRDIIANAPVIAAEGMALGPMLAARELGITGRIDNALGISKAFGIEPDQPMIGTDILTQMGFGQFVNPFKADGGRVGYAPGGDVGFAQRPEFVGGKGSQPDGVSVADDQPRDVQEGSFVINAAAADFAGRDDIEKMIRTAYKKVGNIGQTGQSQEVAINVSKGEVIIPAQLAKVIGYDRLNKINNRGKKEIARRQEKVEAAGGGFIQRKKFAEGGYVDEELRRLFSEFQPKGLEGIIDTPSPQYKSGVEFGDIETGFDLLGLTDFNKLLQAGLRDKRTMSDYVSMSPELHVEDSYSTMGYYKTNRPDLKPDATQSSLVSADYLSPDTLIHELMHKGADRLSQEIEAGNDTFIKAIYENLRGEGIEYFGNAEHRYIQGVVNLAMMDRLLSSDEKVRKVYKNKNQAILDHKGLGLKPYDEAYALQRTRKEILLDEINRVAEMYMTDAQKQDIGDIVDSFGFEAGRVSETFKDALTGEDISYLSEWKISPRKSLDDIPLSSIKNLFSYVNGVMVVSDQNTRDFQTMVDGRRSDNREDMNLPPAKSAGTFGDIEPLPKAEGGFVVPKRKPKQEALADVELRADIEEFIQTDPLARLGWNLYENRDVDMVAVVLPGREGMEVSVGGQYFPTKGEGSKSDLRKNWQSFIFEQNPNKRNILPKDKPSITYLTGKADNYGRYDDIGTMLHELRHHALRHMQSEYDVPLTSLPREETMMDFQDYANRKQARKVKESIPKEHTEKEKELRSKGAWMSPSVGRDVAKYQEIAKIILKERKVPPYKKPKEISSFMERVGNILGF